MLGDFGNFRPMLKGEDLEKYRKECDTRIKVALKNYLANNEHPPSNREPPRDRGLFYPKMG